MADNFPSKDELVADPGYLPGADGNDSQARDALAVVESLREEFSDRDRMIEDLEKVIFLENAVHIPEGFKKTALEVRSPLPSHIVNTVTSALSVNPPSVKFDHPAFGDAAEENAALREAFFDASWLRQEQEARVPIFRQTTHAVIAYSEGIIKTMERKKRAWGSYGAFARKLKTELDANDRLDGDSRDRIFDAKTEEFKRGLAYPIASTMVPPNTFYYLRNEDGFAVCAEVKELPYHEAVERFSVGVNAAGYIVPEAYGLGVAEGMRALERKTVRLSEIWTYDKVTYVLQGNKQIERQQGIVAKTIKHGYGDRANRVLRGPYFHSMGITTSSRELYKQSQSILYAFLRLFPLLDQLLTIRGQAAMTYGFGAFKRKTPPELGMADQPFGVAADETQDEQIRPGYVYPYDIEPINMPSGGIDLDKAIADVRQMIELALPSAAQGVIGGESGYAINQAAHLARLAWNPIIANLEQMLSDRVAFESWIIESRIKEKVYVYGSIPDELQATRKRRRPDEGWLGIDGDDLKGLHRYRVKLKPETPSNQVIEIRMHGDMLKLGLESMKQAREAIGQNPTEVERQLMLEALKGDPAILNVLKQQVFQKVATLQAESLQGVDAAPPQGGPMPDAQQQMAPAAPDQMAAASQNGAGPIPVPQPPVAPPGLPGVPGTPAGAPGGIRNYPANSLPLPGQG